MPNDIKYKKKMHFISKLQNFKIPNIIVHVVIDRSLKGKISVYVTLHSFIFWFCSWFWETCALTLWRLTTYIYVVPHS